MGLGLPEMLIILAVVVVLFGAGKLPSVMGDLAKGVRNFKAGLKDEPRYRQHRRDAADRTASSAATTATHRCGDGARR